MGSKQTEDTNHLSDDNGGNNSLSIPDNSEIRSSLNEISRLLLEIDESNSSRNAAIQRLDSTLQNIQRSLDQAIVRLECNLQDIQQNSARMRGGGNTLSTMEASNVPTQPRVDERAPLAAVIFSVIGQYVSIFISLSSRMRSAAIGHLIGVGLMILAGCVLLFFLIWVLLSFFRCIGLPVRR